MAPTPKPTKTADKYHYAYGRRKTAIASVRLFNKVGDSTINGKSVEAVYPGKIEQKQLMYAFSVLELDPKEFHFTAKVKGSGQMAQLTAISHGLAKAFVVMEPTYKKTLRAAGLLTRDPREVERKKPGLHKARKAEQYSKR